MQPNYLSTELDCETTVAGLKLARTIAATHAMKDYTLDEYRPGPDARSDADLLEFARNHGATIFHPVGTCRMGSDEQAVLDPQLRVRGVDGLRVIDASAMPTLISANTNAASIMVGERGAAFLLGE